MKITLKNREELNFLETGVDGIYVCERAVLIAEFDVKCCNDWEKSSGKKKLQEWAEKNLPKEILEQFDIDIPTMEEVFSKKMIDWWGGDSVKDIVSKQLPIFKNSDERMKEFNDYPIWWWTRSAYAGTPNLVWLVDSGGSIHYDFADIRINLVPVLRKKAGQDPETKYLKEITIGELAEYCGPENCVRCPLGIESDYGRKPCKTPFRLTQEELDAKIKLT